MNPPRPIDPSVRLVHIAESVRSSDPPVLHCQACGVVRVLRDDEPPPPACPCGAPLCEECRDVLAAARRPRSVEQAFHMRRNVRRADPIAAHCDVCGGLVVPTTAEVEAWVQGTDRLNPKAICCPVCGTPACTVCLVLAMAHRQREGWSRSRAVGVA